MDECLELSNHLVHYLESQLLLVVTLWLSGVVIDWMFTLGGVDMRVRLFVDHHCIKFVIRVKFSQLVPTAKLF